MATIQFKRGPLGRWSEKNPVLAVGEPGYVTDNGRIKIGDGKTAWNDLKYTDSDSYEVYPDRTSLPKVGEVGIVYFVIEDRSIRIYKDNDYFAFCSSTAEIGDLREEVTDLTDNVEIINTKIVTLESAHKQITVNKDNISSILEEIHGIKNTIESTNNSISEQTTAIQQLAAALEEHINTSNMGSLENISQLQQTVDQHTEKISELESSDTILRENVTSITEDISELQTELNMQYAMINGHLNQYNQVITNFQEHVDTYDQKVITHTQFKNVFGMDAAEYSGNTVTDRLHTSETKIALAEGILGDLNIYFENNPSRQPITARVDVNEDNISFLSERVSGVESTINETIVNEISKISILKRLFITSIDSDGGVWLISGNKVELSDLEMNTIYMLPYDTTLENTKYKEYMVIEVVSSNGITSRRLEQIGSTDIALDDYTTKQDVVQSLSISFGDSENKEMLYSQDDDDKDVSITIPKADSDKYGVVKSSTDQNKITVLEDGTMTITQITPDKIFGGTIVFYGGNAGASGQ